MTALQARKTSWLSRLLLWTKRFIKWALILLLGYIVFILIGLIPVNNDYKADETGVTIYVASNEVHADLILPRQNDICDWNSKLRSDWFPVWDEQCEYLAIGWGDRGFYLDTQSWEDFRLSTAASALFLPTESCLHITQVNPDYYSEYYEVKISKKAYNDLVRYIDQTFHKTGSGQFQPIVGYHYGQRDAFFKANGSYHMLYSCNSWAGFGLQQAGVKSPWYPILPHTPTMYLQPFKKDE